MGRQVFAWPARLDRANIPGFGDSLKNCDKVNGGLIFGYHVKDPRRYGVVEFDNQNKDSCRRFIGLIDMLYENNCSIVILASKPVNSLNNINTLAEEFKRTASRLYEMTIVKPD